MAKPFRKNQRYAFNGQSHDVKERLATVANYAPVAVISILERSKRLGTAIIRITVIHAALRRMYYSAQRCASHSLRFTSPASFFLPAYTHRLNCACISSVGAFARIFASSVEPARLPAPRL